MTLHDKTGLAEANKAIVAAYHEALWQGGDKGAIDRTWSPDAKVHMTDFEGTAVDVVRADVERYLGAFTEIETRIAAARTAAGTARTALTRAEAAAREARQNIDRAVTQIERLAGQRKPGFGSFMGTFLASAIWHGIAPGYYLSFVTAALGQWLARRLRKSVRPLFYADVRRPDPSWTNMSSPSGADGVPT